jgi:hypothetical protein
MIKIIVALLLICSCAGIKQDRHYNSKTDDCDSTKFNCIDVRKWR